MTLEERRLIEDYRQASSRHKFLIRDLASTAADLARVNNMEAHSQIACVIDISAGRAGQGERQS